MSAAARLTGDHWAVEGFARMGPKGELTLIGVG